eukprot:gene10172-biopygen9554
MSPVTFLLLPLLLWPARGAAGGGLVVGSFNIQVFGTPHLFRLQAQSNNCKDSWVGNPTTERICKTKGSGSPVVHATVVVIAIVLIAAVVALLLCCRRRSPSKCSGMVAEMWRPYPNSVCTVVPPPCWRSEFTSGGLANIRSPAPSGLFIFGVYHGCACCGLYIPV